MVCEQLAVHPEAHLHGLGVRGAFAGQAEADVVLGVEIDAMGGFDGAQIQAADGSCFWRGTATSIGFRQRIGAHGAGGDRLGGVQVLLHQHRRDGQDVADVVEAVAGIVGREILVGAEVDAEQVADGVASIRCGSAGAR